MYSNDGLESVVSGGWMGIDIPKDWSKTEKKKESKATVQDGPRAAYEAISDRLVKMEENKKAIPGEDPRCLYTPGQGPVVHDSGFP